MSDALDEKEMSLINIAIEGAHIWGEDPALRKLLYKNVLSYLKMTEILEAKSVRIDTAGGGYHGSIEMTEE